MSILLGEIRQLGMVVRDGEAAMRAWGKLGVGPFFSMHFALDDFVYRGQPSPAPEVTVYIAHSGPFQIELIQQHNRVPSAYTEFLDSGREGAQHVSSWFRDHASYDATHKKCLDHGFVLVHEGCVHSVGGRFAYFETDVPGMMFEISESLLPQIAAGLRMIEDAARTWDGKQLLASELTFKT